LAADVKHQKLIDLYLPASQGSPNLRAYLPHKYAVDNICSMRHTVTVSWQVYFHAEFEPEFDVLEREVQDELLAHANLLKALGPQLKRQRPILFMVRSTTT
jgi:hypothetical protein